MNIPEKVQSQLLELGLTPTEATLYVAGLSIPDATIPDYVKATQIKRPTIYHALGTLTEKGLASYRKRGSKTHYTMAEPEAIKSLVELKRVKLDDQYKKLDEFLPLLSQYIAGKGDEVTVVHHHGMEGVKMVMDAAFRCRSKQWDIIAPYKNFLREYDSEYAKRYLRTRKVQGIVSRTLWEDVPKTTRAFTDEERRERNPRIMPESMQGKFASMIILFDDKVAIFSSYEKQSAILITSSEIHSLFTALFDGLWEVSKEY